MAALVSILTCFIGYLCAFCEIYSGARDGEELFYVMMFGVWEGSGETKNIHTSEAHKQTR